MIALFTEAPRFCPECGEAITWGRNPHGDQDWLAHCSHSCGSCGTQYQLVTPEHALTAATASGGDLAQWADR